MEEAAKEYREREVWLPELGRYSNILDGFVFYRCKIYGPAIVILGDNIIFASNYSTGAPDEVHWLVYEDVQSTVGAITMYNSLFEWCCFHRVGFAHKEEGREQLKGTMAYVDRPFWPAPQE